MVPDADYQQARRLITYAARDARHALNEADAKNLLRLYGVKVPPGSVVHNEDDARDTAEFISYPVVMKAVSSRFQHKTEAGLVVLGIRDDAAALRAFAVLKESA
jgi:acyl-CoA synthetase (NDP forming)